MKLLRQIIDGIDRVFEFVEKYVTAIPLLIFTFAIFANVMGRYVFHTSITWAEELSRYLNLIVIFLGLSAGIKTDDHIGVDAIQILLIPKRFHKYMDILRFAITTVFCFVTACIGWNLAMQFLQLGQKSPAMMLPMWIPYMTLPIGLFMAAVRSLIRIILLIIGQPGIEEKEA